MNTKIYKKVHTQAIELLKAVDNEDDELFMQLYDELKALCYDNEDVEAKNHPVQWETLADFTEDTDDAIELYQKALGFAHTIQANDYLASINYALATLCQESNQTEQATDYAQQADQHAKNIIDKELQKEIKSLLKSLK